MQPPNQPRSESPSAPAEAAAAAGSKLIFCNAVQSPPSSEGDAPPAESEAQLKGELAGLRAAIQAARSDVRQMRAQLAAMDRDLALHGEFFGLGAPGFSAGHLGTVLWRCIDCSGAPRRLSPLVGPIGAGRPECAVAARFRFAC